MTDLDTPSQPKETREMTSRKIAELVRSGDFVGATQVAKRSANTSRKAVEELIVGLYDQTNGGGLLRWCEPDVATAAAATLLVLLAERYAARAELSDALAENEVLRVRVNDLRNDILRTAFSHMEACHCDDAEAA